MKAKDYEPKRSWVSWGRTAGIIAVVIGSLLHYGGWEIVEYLAAILIGAVMLGLFVWWVIRPDMFELTFGKLIDLEAIERKLFKSADDWDLVGHKQPEGGATTANDEDPVADFNGTDATGNRERLLTFLAWPFTIYQHLTLHPVADATDQCEDIMWWLFAIAVFSLIFVGWCYEDSNVSFLAVILSYVGSGIVLQGLLRYRRTNFDWP